jgi:hypothetical protein
MNENDKDIYAALFMICCGGILLMIAFVLLASPGG